MTFGALSQFVRLAIASCMIGLVFAGTCLPATAADATAHDISKLLFDAAPGSHPDLSGKTLSRLDLAGLNFKKANLRGANFFGADLTGADLSDTNLEGAQLDRVTLIGTKLDRARLDNASLMRPSTSQGLVAVAGEAPSFKGASLRGVHFFGTFRWADMSGADLTDSVCAPTNKTGFIEHIWRTDFTSATLADATLLRADMTRANLSFANLKGAVLRGAILRDADLSGANLTGADLSGADLTGADLTGANVTDANLAGTKLHDVTGFETLKGASLARNAGKAIP